MVAYITVCIFRSMVPPSPSTTILGALTYEAIKKGKDSEQLISSHRTVNGNIPLDKPVLFPCKPKLVCVFAYTYTRHTVCILLTGMNGTGSWWL